MEGHRRVESQITNPADFHPMCRPEEEFDPKSGSCVPRNKGPIGSLECPPGTKLDVNLGLCVPESPMAQAEIEETGAPFKPTGKMERCITSVKQTLRKTRKGMDSQAVKSAAIAICRSRLNAAEKGGKASGEN